MSAVLNKALIVCVSLCVAACATSRSPPGAAKGAAADIRPPAGCVADTATRIPVSPRECAGFGRVWTQEDVKTTGATSAGEALRLLDPSVTVH